MLKVSCIIPAYNEANRIAEVLRVVSTHALIDEVIVVDDGSTDGTKQIVAVFKHVRLVVHTENRGKSAAAHTGISAARGEFILLIDADLAGLTAENVTSLLIPVLDGHAETSMSLKGNDPKLRHIIGLSYLSGDRAFPRKTIEDVLGNIASLPSYGLEVFLNMLAIRHRSRIAVVRWPNVKNTDKREKFGFWKGLLGEAFMMQDVFKTVSVAGPVYQIVRMLKLRIHDTMSMEIPKISFVVPAHNEEKYIGQCLQSILRELTSVNHEAEVIVVNNASTDSTKEIARSFPGVRVVDEPNKGLTRARRAGFIASTGDLVANIDADTILPEGWLGTVLQEFQANKKLVALSGPSIYYDLPPHKLILVKLFYWAGFLVHLFNHRVLRKGAMLQGGNSVVRRRALEQVGGYDTSIAFYGEDTDVARRISQVGRVKWTFRLPIYTSARRLKHEGLMLTGIRYSFNYLWTTFRRRPFTHAYRDIRE